MHSFRLADLYMFRRRKYRVIYVHRCHDGDVTEGVVELLYGDFPFPS